MPLRFNAPALSFDTPRRIIHCSLLLLLTLSLLAGTLAAQTDQERKRAESLRFFSDAAERFFNEGTQLRAEGSKESLQKAIQKFAQAQQYFHLLNDSVHEALTVLAIGVTYNELGDNQKALEYYTQALPLWRAVANLEGEAATTISNSGQAITLRNIGTVYEVLGEAQKALESFAQSLQLARAAGDREGEASARVGVGNAYAALGESQKALDDFAQALLLSRALSDRGGEATALASIGKVYSDLGESQKALDYYEQALPLFRRATGRRRGEAVTLDNIGNVYATLSENQKALDYYTQALSLFRAIADRQLEAVMLNNIGSIYKTVGENQKALEYFAQSLQMARAVGDRLGEAVTLNNIGWTYETVGENQKALDHYAQALQLVHALGVQRFEAGVLGNIAILERSMGHFAEARVRSEAAIAIVESLRTKITNQELRTSFFADVQGYYVLYIDILMSLHKQRPNEGHDGEALQMSERARARALLETLAEANADIRQGVDPRLVERERTLQQRLNAKAQQQMKLLGSPHTDEQAQAIAKGIGALTTEFQQVETQIRQTSPRYAALTQPQPLTLKDIRTQVLDADTLLLEYSLGAERSYLWAVTPNSITSYELPGREEIETAARRVYEILNARNQRIEGETPAQRQARIAQADAQYQDAAALLSRMVLAPLAKQLGDKRLLIVSDGALQYIPFAALPDPASAADSTAPLVVKHEIVSLPSASTLSVLRQEVKDRKPAAKAVAVLADPVFEETDERVKGNAGQAMGPARRKRPRTGKRRELPSVMERSAEESGLRGTELEIPRLPGTRLEAAQILSLVPATESKQALDFNASRATATNADLSQYRYVHFATHGFLNSLHPELSGVVLSMVDENGKPQDGFLRAHEIFNLKLPAELVVLSACQTGLGKEIKGEGLVGITRGFMYAGAPRVVVSLWSVSDAATAELMTRFYRGMLKEGMRPAAALRAAHVSLMNDQRWKAPFYWAAFTLQGEWR